MNRLYVNIGNNVEINVNKISFIFEKADYEDKYKALNIKNVFKMENSTVFSYVIIKEFGDYYAYESIYTPETITKRIYRLLHKNQQ